MRYFLDTQLYSYLANGTIARREWLRVLAGRQLWLSPITVYELLEGLLNASAHTHRWSMAALSEAAAIPDERFLVFAGIAGAAMRRWLDSAGDELPDDFYKFRQAVEAGRETFLGQIRRLMKMVMPNYRRIGDPLFSAEWQAVAGRTPGDNLDAPFVLQTAVLQRAMRIRYNLDKHPSDYLDYLQLRFLNEQDLTFITADRKLAMMTSRSLQSDRIYTWDELISPQTRQ